MVERHCDEYFSIAFCFIFYLDIIVLVISSEQVTIYYELYIFTLTNVGTVNI